jgi:hypothetical protein
MWASRSITQISGVGVRTDDPLSADRPTIGQQCPEVVEYYDPVAQQFPALLEVVAENMRGETVRCVRIRARRTMFANAYTGATLA